MGGLLEVFDGDWVFRVKNGVWLMVGVGIIVVLGVLVVFIDVLSGVFDVKVCVELGFLVVWSFGVGIGWELVKMVGNVKDVLVCLFVDFVEVVVFIWVLV